MTDINLFITLAGTARHGHRYTERQGAGGWQEGGGKSVWCLAFSSAQYSAQTQAAACQFLRLRIHFACLKVNCRPIK